MEVCKMNRMTAVVICAGLLLAGCGDDPLGPEDYNINGTWSGSITSPDPDPVPLTITITETNGSISGSGNYVVMSISVSFPVTGYRAGANVGWTMRPAAGWTRFSFAGEITTETRIVGRLTDTGLLTHQSLTLTKSGG